MSEQPEVTAAELAIMQDELLAGLPIPDTSEPADMAAWRAEHTAEPEAG